MRDPDAAFLAALEAAPDFGIVPQQFVWIEAKNRATGALETIGLWTGDEPVTVDVISGTTGGLVSRSYIGAVNLVVPSIPRVANLTNNRIAISMSQIADTAQLLVREYEPRLARVEIHDGLIDPATRALVSAPEITFIGVVDGTPIATPAVGGEGAIEMDLVSDAMAMLTRTNPAKRSHEHQKRRSASDTFAVYAGTVGEWQIWWGENGDQPEKGTRTQREGPQQ